MTGKVSIRAAVRGDVPVIARMMGEFFDYLCALEGSVSTFDADAAVPKLERGGFGKRPLFEALIAERGREAVGYAIYTLGYWPDTLEGMVFLSDLFVRHAARGQGIGKALMERLGEAGRAENCSLIMWTVWDPNVAAQQFYHRLGARRIADEQLMTLAISR